MFFKLIKTGLPIFLFINCFFQTKTLQAQIDTIELRIVAINPLGVPTTNAHICMGEADVLYSATTDVTLFGQLTTLLTDAAVDAATSFFTLQLLPDKTYQLLSLDDHQNVIHSTAISTQNAVVTASPHYVYLKTD